MAEHTPDQHTERVCLPLTHSADVVLGDEVSVTSQVRSLLMWHCPWYGVLSCWNEVMACAAEDRQDTLKSEDIKGKECEKMNCKLHKKCSNIAKGKGKELTKTLNINNLTAKQRGREVEPNKKQKKQVMKDTDLLSQLSGWYQNKGYGRSSWKTKHKKRNWQRRTTTKHKPWRKTGDGKTLYEQNLSMIITQLITWNVLFCASTLEAHLQWQATVVEEIHTKAKHRTRFCQNPEGNDTNNATLRGFKERNYATFLSRNRPTKCPNMAAGQAALLWLRNPFPFTSIKQKQEKPTRRRDKQRSKRNK